MIVQYHPQFHKQLKKADVRIRKSFKQKILLFSKNPHELSLNNHALRDEYEGYRSIDIADNVRAIYEEAKVQGEIVAYFYLLGTHKELYG